MYVLTTVVKFHLFGSCAKNSLLNFQVRCTSGGKELGCKSVSLVTASRTIEVCLCI